jgi:hypothetical protein
LPMTEQWCFFGGTIFFGTHVKTRTAAIATIRVLNQRLGP